MRNISREDRQKIARIVSDIAPQRRALIQFRADDRSLSFFRMQAEHHALVIVRHHATGQPLPRETKGFIATYLNPDNGDCDQPVQDFITAVERATGRALDY